ncbi:glycoside hydrolase family 65 protein [Prolixibacteraceae bacterium JC049]|nr:glycoside hydrolase family 65 protein [Prolixibacteraceae bacterium JC049]
MLGILPSEHPLKIENVVMNGVYDIYGRKDSISNIVQGINFCNLDIRFEDGSRLSEIPTNNLDKWEQKLDMKKAIFSGNYAVNGLKVSNEVVALRNLPYNVLVNVVLEAEKDISIVVENEMSLGQGVNPVQYLTKKFHTPKGEVKVAVNKTTTITSKKKVVATSAFLFEEGKHPKEVKDGNQSMGFELKLKKGERFAFSLVGATCSTVDYVDPANEAKRFTLFAWLEGKEALLKRHTQAWADLWKGDVVVEGNVEDQKNIRLALYHLYAFVRKGSGYSLSPMGLSGTGYAGHIFWDCETWMYPVFLMLHPELAHSILDYRYNRMDAAKQKAFSHGYDGLMFPWESAESGSEDTPVWALSGPFEHHISSDIAFAFWNYYLVTKDVKWLKEKGYPVIKGVADYWVSRVEKNDKGEYEIKNVVCADEWAENVDNNAFTNGGAKRVLEYAAKAAKVLGETASKQWEVVADGIPIRRFDTGVVKEFETYHGQRIKQADVNLLTYPLGIVSDKKTMAANLDYYSKKVNGGPAMTHSIYSIISNRLGRIDEAYSYFNRGHRPNLRPPFGVFAETETSNNPYFITGAGGMLQAVLYGFGGLEIGEDGIKQVKSKLPKSWKKLTIKGIGGTERSVTIENK